MQQAFQHLAAVLFSFFIWPVACSKRKCTPECFESLQLTGDSLGHCTAHLSHGHADPLVVELQSFLVTNEFYQGLCMKYLVGSVAIFGKVDVCGSRTLFELCKEMRFGLPELLDKLMRRNDRDTVAQFMADHIETWISSIDFERLIEENWNGMEVLVMKSLDILRNAKQNHQYRLMLRSLPADRRYEIIKTGIDLSLGGNVYSEKDPSLREVFFLARCSRNPDPEIRRLIAYKFPSYKQSLADDEVVSKTASPCTESIVPLSSDVLHRISKFMDIETLVYVMPMVCRMWRSLYWKIMIEDTRIHDLYLQDLHSTELCDIHRIMPWKWYFEDGTNELTYFGRCIEDGGLDRIKPTSCLMGNLMKYLEAVAEGRTLLLKTGDCATQSEAFMRLFERVYKCCESGKPVLNKPTFLSDKEYEGMVCHFVHEKKGELGLPVSLFVDDMPKLYGITKESGKLMKQLIHRSIHNYNEATFALIICGQTKEIPDKLARFIFSLTDMFRVLIKPKVVPCSEYYNSIVESGVLSKVVRKCFNNQGLFLQFMVSIILFFKDSPDTISRIEMQITCKFEEHHSLLLRRARQRLGDASFRDLMAAKGYSAENLEFFKGFMTRCGLL